MPEKLYGFAVNVPSVRPDGLNFEKIEQAGEVTLDDSARNRLVLLLDEYLGALSSYQQAPRPGEARKYLNNIESMSQALAKALGNIGTSTTKMAAVNRVLDVLETPARLTELTRQLYSLSAAARRAVEDLPVDKGGVDGDPYRTPLIKELHSLFTAAGGSGRITKNNYNSDAPYGGRFYLFVEAVLIGIGSPVNATNHALGNAIETALKD